MIIPLFNRVLTIPEWCRILSINSRSLGTLRRVVFQSVLDDIKDFSDQPIALSFRDDSGSRSPNWRETGLFMEAWGNLYHQKICRCCRFWECIKTSGCYENHGVPRVFVDWDVWRLVFQFQIFDLQEMHTLLAKSLLGFWTTFLNKKYLWVQAAVQTVCYLVASMQFQTKAATLVVFSFAPSAICSSTVKTIYRIPACQRWTMIGTSLPWL